MNYRYFDFGPYNISAFDFWIIDISSSCANDMVYYLMRQGLISSLPPDMLGFSLF